MGQSALREVLRGAAVTLLVLGGTLLPHWPGRYDAFAVTLSVMLRVFGFLALLLVPVGLLWLLVGRRHLLFSRIAIAVALVPCIGAGVVAVALGAASAGIIAMSLCGIALLVYAWSVADRLKDFSGRFAPVAFTLVATPLVIVALQRALLPRWVESSRARAIANSAEIIRDIERYRAANGEYPLSLLAAWPDYNPGVIGIERYHYERHGAAYNLIFENPALAFGTREFVVYNPRDEQGFTAHATDILQLSPAELAIERTRGHYAVRSTSHPHWKYFWFD